MDMEGAIHRDTCLFFTLKLLLSIYIGMIRLIALASQIHSGERQDNFNGRDKIDIRTAAWFMLSIFYYDKTITIFINHQKMCIANCINCQIVS